MHFPDGLLSTLLEVFGLVAVVAAAWAWEPLAGVAAAGVVSVLLGYVLGSRSRL